MNAANTHNHAAPIATNLHAIKATLPPSVCLIAVSKTFTVDAVRAAVAAGQRDFGENYVQESIDKIGSLSASERAQTVWHFIGPLQSNKTKLVAEHFDWVHTIDRLKIAQRLSEQRPAQLAPLKVCVQINISAQGSKSGVLAAEAAELIAAIGALPRLELCGLMTIPDPNDAGAFTRMAQLRDALQQQTQIALPVLSMGMSADYPAAIAAGATHIRVGSAVFGARG